MSKKVSYTKQSEKELYKILRDMQKELGNARFSAAGSRASNTSEGRNAKKEIARIKTEIRRRVLAEEQK
jgi:ribosomal protein L29